MIRIRASATSANLGPGFDCLGIALNLYNTFEVELSNKLVLLGCDPVLAGPDNLFVQACRRGFEVAGKPFPELAVKFSADIPVARGLGSSAACIVGGLLAADALTGNALGYSLILDLAAQMEGHPDNVAPALLGGFTASVLESGKTTTIRTDLGRDLRFNALIPDFELKTSTARAALPATMPFKDAVFNSGRAALTTAAFLTHDWPALKVACADRLHEQYRAPLIPGFHEITHESRRAGAIASFLSGAGPTIMAITESSNSEFVSRLEAFLVQLPGPSWRILSLSADDSGARVEQIPTISCF